MTDQDAIDTLNGYSNGQIAYHNYICELKVHLFKNSTPNRSTKQDVDDVVAHLDLMPQQKIDDDISPSLSDKNKLSQRPC